MTAADFLARWRVRLGYPLAILILWLARPTPVSILCGMIVGSAGLLLRARAAGHLHKQTVLTMTGPYAYTRNPLYLGSAVVAVGVAIGAHSWIAGVILCGYFALFYWPVMRREEQEIRAQHGSAFEAYAQAVPLFFPRLTPAKSASTSPASFSLAQYKKNREYRAAIGFLFVMGVLLVIWRLRLP